MQPRPRASPEPRQCGHRCCHAVCGSVSPYDLSQRQQQRRAAPEGGPRRASPTSGLPSFAYNRSVRHNVMSGGSEEAAATCSVCLGALQVGETVRLLPVCLHLYHVECIDPGWTRTRRARSAGRAPTRRRWTVCFLRFRRGRLQFGLGACIWFFIGRE